MRAILTPDDLKKGELAPVGWWPMEITEYKEEPASTDKSANCIFTFKILDGPAKGIVANKLFNEKSLGFGKTLYAVLGFPKTPDGGFDLSTELFQKTVGFKLMGYIQHGLSNKGNKFNDVTDFKPLA
jgi:hypothetical protein